MTNDWERIREKIDILFKGVRYDYFDLKSKLINFVLSERKAAQIELLKQICENCEESAAQEGLTPDCSNSDHCVQIYQKLEELTNEN